MNRLRFFSLHVHERKEKNDESIKQGLCTKWSTIDSLHNLFSLSLSLFTTQFFLLSFFCRERWTEEMLNDEIKRDEDERYHRFDSLFSFTKIHDPTFVNMRTNLFSSFFFFFSIFSFFSLILSLFFFSFDPLSSFSSMLGNLFSLKEKNFWRKKK